MNTFTAFTSNDTPRIARLVAVGTRTLANRLGRSVSDVETLNVRRKAKIVAALETIGNAGEKVCAGFACALPCVPCQKLSNRFSLPSDNWYQIAPKGNFTHPKGLVQVIDDEAGKAMVNQFQKEKANPNFPGLLIDRDHTSQDGSSEAAGWIQNLQWRGEQGLWAMINWSNSGREDVEGGSYRGIIPSWRRSDCVPVEGSPDNYCRPTRLSDAGITNQPNLPGMVPLSK